METFDFPDSILDLAGTITLKELLDAPFAQPWIISALANAAHFSRQEEDIVEADVVLAARVGRLIRSIPREEKLSLYRQCGVMVQSRKEDKRQHLERVRVAAPVKEQN